MMIQKVLPKESFWNVIMRTMLNDIKYFPVAKDNVSHYFIYEDSWEKKEHMAETDTMKERI